MSCIFNIHHTMGSKRNNKKAAGKQHKKRDSSVSVSSSTNNTQKCQKKSLVVSEKYSSCFPPHLLKPQKSSIYNSYKKSILKPLYEGAVYFSEQFFSNEECKAWIAYIENECGGFEKTSQKATRYYAHRECGRFQRNDWVMSGRLYDRMESLALELHDNVKEYLPSNCARPKTCNGNLRLYKYDRGMSFGKHYDSSDSTQHGDTAVTVLIYLSSCKGGATRFYPPKDGSSQVDKVSSKEGIGFVPVQGAILMHMHGPLCLQHEADAVQEGIKYVLRTDIVYGKC